MEESSNTRYDILEIPNMMQRTHIRFESSDSSDSSSESSGWSSDSSVTEEEHILLDYGDAVESEPEDEPTEPTTESVESNGRIYPTVYKTMLLKDTRLRQIRENRDAFAKIIINNATFFTDPNYDEIEVFYDIQKHKENCENPTIQFEYLLPRINTDHTFGKTYTKKDRFYPYVNIMNMRDDTTFCKQMDAFANSFYSLETLQHFAMYACADFRNIMKSYNKQFKTLSYWMRIPTFTMTYKEGLEVDRMITMNQHIERKQFHDSTSFHARDHTLFSELLRSIRSEPVGKWWYEDEINM